jgi:hypothetical protein
MMESGRNPCLGRSLVSFYWLGVIIAVVAINPPNRLVFQGDGTNQILAEDYGKRTSVIANACRDNDTVIRDAPKSR